MSNPYTPADVLQILWKDLQSWIATKKGSVSIARDPLDVYELLGATGMNATRLVLHWAGENEFAGNILQPLVSHQVEVFVQMNLGLTAQKDGGLLDPQGSRPALLDLVQQTRTRVLELKFPAEITRKYFNYVGCDPVVTPSGFPLAAYKLKFKLDAAIAAITYRDAPTV
jgi:hypothetical protein